MKTKKASVKWQGTIKSGQGKITTESGVLNESPYSFSTRFGDAQGTNPEELIGAALAACFSMAFAATLQRKKFTPEMIQTHVDVDMKQSEDAWSVTDVRIETSARADKITQAEIQEIAEETKKNCPVAKLLNANITVEASVMDEASAKQYSTAEAQPHATH